MRIWTRRIAASAVAMIWWTGMTAASAQPQSVTVTIGTAGPVSGPIAQLGQDNENGARLAVEEINAAGLVIGGKKVTLKLQTEDDAADPKQATTVANKLVDAKVAGIIGHMTSGTTIPASKIYNAAGLPEISPSATNPQYTRQGFKTAFRVVANDAQLGATLGHYAVEQLKAKTIAVIDDRTAYGQGVASEFAKAAQAAGAKIVGHEYTSDKATDFTAILTTIKGKRPDIIFLGGMDAVGGPMLRQMKQLGIDAKFMGGDGICTGQFLKLADNAAADGQIYCAAAGGVEAARKAGLDDFNRRFKARFGYQQLMYAAYVYDAVKVMVAAMQKAGSWEPARYLPQLAALHYSGVTGDIAFDARGDLKNAALTLSTNKGGQLVELAVVRVD